MKWLGISIVLIGIVAVIFYWGTDTSEVLPTPEPTPTVTTATTTPAVLPETTAEVLPLAMTIPGLSHVGQSFNNCSSVGLFITLSHWGINDTQEKIAEATRPWNNPRGDNDDKSVTLYELADYTREKYGLHTYVRPDGDIELLKKFVANNIPVLTRALMYPKDDIVHYRVIRGYDESKKIVIESDGIEGPMKPYTYDAWMHMWKDFNYAYLIIVPTEKKELAEKLLGESLDEKTAWKNAQLRAEQEVAADPNNLRAKYNIVTALYYQGDYAGTVQEFEKIENELSRRKLWYQPEPIEAYFKLGNYDRVMALTEHIINDSNKSVSEMYYMRGQIFESRNDIAPAKAEYEKAIMYHRHFKPARDALAALSN